MNRIFFFSVLFLCYFIVSSPQELFAQTDKHPPIESLELSEDEGIPVIIKHLPDWKSKQNIAKFIRNGDELRAVMGEQPVFKVVEFIADTEAVTADYPEGRLLIVEYGTPQASVFIDARIKQFLQTNPTDPPVFYKRIGNYSVFVFDGSESSADVLFNQIKYEKVIRWLSYDPFARKRAERSFIRDTRDLFLATFLLVLSGIFVALIIGGFTGYIFFKYREKQRAGMESYSDGGGLTRINLDELTPVIKPTRLFDD